MVSVISYLQLDLFWNQQPLQEKKSCCLFACLFLCVFLGIKNICYALPCHYLRGLVQSNVSHSLEWPLHRKCTRLYYVIYYILLLNWYEPHISWKLIWKLAQKRTQQCVKKISEGAFLIMIYHEIFLNFMDDIGLNHTGNEFPDWIDRTGHPNLQDRSCQTGLNPVNTYLKILPTKYELSILIR